MRALFLSFIILNLTGCANLSDFPASNTKSVQVYSVPLDGSKSTITATAPREYPRQITLLLPLQGQFASSGQAIRDGFMMAYQNAPADARPVKITVIDSSDLSQIQTKYNEATQQGANFIIGPLAKPQVQAIAQVGRLSVPTLALNYLDTVQSSSSQFYQFGLSPLDEAQQVAKLARQSGKQNAIIMVPSGSWGQSVANAFQNTWQASGGTVVTTYYLPAANQSLAKSLRDLLRFKQANKKAEPQRREDFDIILLAASPTVARQVKPLLKFYYAGDVPVYATSMVYSGATQTRLDSDLNGVIFCDAPWALNKKNSETDLRQKIESTYPDSFQNRAKLYALGVDAYHIATHFKEMTTSQQTLTGATGDLSFNSQRVVRQLSCAQFRDGAPVLLSA